jgi:adenylate cyclase
VAHPSQRSDQRRGRGPLASVWAELRRRRVVRTASVYVVAGWATTQIASTVGPVLLLPDWFPRAVVLLVVLGFPVAVGLAWAFDVTPDGIRRARRGPAPPAPRPHAFRYAAAGALAALVLTAGYMRVVANGDAGSAQAAGEAIRSLAVLPFVDMSSTGDQEYFSDGIAEELLNVLAQLPGLQVAARTSSFAFKGQNEHVAEIGRKLNVQAVLEGSVRRDGERIRVTAQLIDARTGFHLWSENYDREAAGVLALQDEIARAIVAALRLRLAADVGPAGARTASIDPETHGLYLRGRHHWNRRRTEDFHRAIDYFEQSIARDPGYAPAHAGLALAQITLTGYDNATLAAMLPRARAAAAWALELDPFNADAHAALGLATRREHDWSGTERNLRRALELNPSHVTALHWLSQHLIAMGRVEEALALARRALALDPLSLVINNNLGFLHLLIGDYAAAAAALEATLELDPTFPVALGNLWAAYVGLGRYDEALRTIERRETFGAAQAAMRRFAEALRDGGRAAALEVVDGLARADAGTYLLALSYAQVGDTAHALDWLERAQRERHYNMPYIAIEVRFRPLHGQPRFEALIRELNLEHVPRN